MVKTNKILENREIKGGGGGKKVAQQQCDISMVAIYFYSKKVAKDYRKGSFFQNLIHICGMRVA